MNDALDYRTCLPAWRKDQEDMILSFPIWRRIRSGISRLIYSGDGDHKMICIVRQDVTETMTAERRSKETLSRRWRWQRRPTGPKATSSPP